MDRMMVDESKKSAGGMEMYSRRKWYSSTGPLVRTSVRKSGSELGHSKKFDMKTKMGLPAGATLNPT